MKDDILLRLHLLGGGDAGRAVIREAIDSLEVPHWRALIDRAQARNDESRERIEDAISWTLWDIAGPTLSGDLDWCDPDIAELIDARAAIALGNLREHARARGVPASMLTAWSETTMPSLARWILNDAGLSVTTEHVPVALWIARAARDPARAEALTTVRHVGGVGGSLLDRIDEIQPCDLICDSVVGVLEATSRRLVREVWDGPEELAERAAWEDRLPEGVTRLRFFTELHAEGAELRHCVGLDASYAEGVAEGSHEIFSLRLGDARATAQISRDGKLVQCRGPSNSEPSPNLRALAQRIVAVMR